MLWLQVAAGDCNNENNPWMDFCEGQMLSDLSLIFSSRQQQLHLLQVSVLYSSIGLERYLVTLTALKFLCLVISMSCDGTFYEANVIHTSIQQRALMQIN